jgi:hypothetical protein
MSPIARFYVAKLVWIPFIPLILIVSRFNDRIALIALFAGVACALGEKSIAGGY